MQIAIFGISSSGLTIATNLLVLFLVMVYFALIYWTYLDARRRIEDPVLIACSTAASIFPFVGTIVYTILRPPEFLEDVRERELEIRASELRVRELIEQSCPHCEYPVERSFLRCPNCERKLKAPCGSCGKPLDPKWGVCPYCETAVRKQQQPRQQRRQQQREPRESRGDQARRERQERRRRAQQRTEAARQQQSQRSSGRSPSAGGSGGSGQSTRPTVQRSEGRSRAAEWPGR